MIKYSPQVVAPDTAVNHIITPLTTTVEFSSEISLTIYNLQKRCDESCLKGKAGFLMISVKNKSFSNKLIEHYFDFVDRYLEHGYITIVDEPYVHNIQAMDCDDLTKEVEMNKLERIASENQRRVKRLLAKRDFQNIEQILWKDLEKQTPGWLVEEIMSAFKMKGKFYRDIINRTKEVLPNKVASEHQLEKFSMFLVKETPTLCNQYYLQNDRIIDIYPGENPDFLWKIESGYYADELPRLNEIAQRSSGLIYVDFQIIK